MKNRDKGEKRWPSMRLKGYDYSQTGIYFITICVNNRECILGKVINGRMVENNACLLVRDVWEILSVRFPEVQLHNFVVMPNHLHGILGIIERDLIKRDAASSGDAASSAPTLGKIIRAFKSISAIEVNRLLNRSGQFWQRNYYDHIIHSDKDLWLHQQYILDNPGRWSEDEENPNNQPK